MIFHLQFNSFATRMCTYVLSFTLVVFVAIMGIFYSFSRQKVTDYAITHTHGQLQNMATQISSLLLTVETTINQSEWIVEQNLTEPDSLFRIINAVVENNDLIVGSGIAFVPDYYKDKGKYFMPYSFLQNGKIENQILGSVDYDYPCMDWYLIPILLKRSYWSEPYYDQGGGNFIMSTYSRPLYDKFGNVYAIFTANISLSQFTNMVNELKPYSSSFSFLLSRNGSYLTHQDQAKIMNETIFSDAFSNHISELETIGYEMQAGHTGTAKININNDSVYAFYTAISNTGWSVCNISPANIILSELDSISRQVIGLFLAGLILLFPLLYITIQRIVRPLKAFSESARTIATGRFNVKLYNVRSKDEIKDLHDSLTYMQQSLSTYITELKQTTAAKERIESELEIAREIQMGMIPKSFPPFPEREDVDLHALLNPAKEVGGDLYDFFIENERLYFIIGDVSGKGVPASLFMAITRSLFRTLAPQKLSPAEIITSMNNSISENNESNMFVTLIIGIFDLHTGILKVCNAGHNFPILILPNGDVSLMELHSHLFLGILKDYIYHDEEYTFKPGTKLFFYTDGVTEAENSSKELYGEDRLIKAISKSHSSNICEMTDTVIQSVHQHVQDAEPSDDLTILIIHYKSQTNNNSTLL